MDPVLLIPVSNKKTFTTTWKTNNAGSSNADQILLPLVNGGTYDFRVLWGDGTSDTITTWDAAAKTHTYAAGAGTYRVRITGTITRWAFNNGGDKLKLLTIERWGGLKLTTDAGAFYGCANMTCSATDAPDLSEADTTLASCFRGCSLFNGNMSAWNTSAVVNMSAMFQLAAAFNQSVASFNTANVTTMANMFNGCTVFNQPVPFNTANVASLHSTFYGCAAFNQSLASFNTAKVATMAYTFYGCAAFNQSLASFNTAKVASLYETFRGCDAFNQSVAHFDTKAVTTMVGTFRLATSFQQSIAAWATAPSNVRLVETMSSMFLSTTQSTTNYDAWLIALAADGANLTLAVPLHMGSSKYTKAESAAATARAALVALDPAVPRWTITDGGPTA